MISHYTERDYWILWWSDKWPGQDNYYCYDGNWNWVKGHWCSVDQGCPEGKTGCFDA